MPHNAAGKRLLRKYRIKDMPIFDLEKKTEMKWRQMLNLLKKLKKIT